jgi:hypothetical protein
MLEQPLEQPMMEKLAAMRLQGMLDALEQQHKDPGSGELSFLERLAAGRPPVELAAKSSAGAAVTSGETAR